MGRRGVAACVTYDLGIIGVGKLGSALGRLALDAGLDVAVADDPSRPLLELVVGSVLPGAHLVDAAALLASSAVVILAVPQPVVAGLPLAQAGDAVVVDATNAWEATDGVRADGPTTAALAARHPELRLVKTLNHFAYADLLADARPSGAPGRRAVAVAGDDADAVAQVAAVVDALGFDPVGVGMDSAELLEPGGPVFGRVLTASDLRAALA
nr:NAD(P)-binding domain-containing protein [Propioniciclava soli]